MLSRVGHHRYDYVGIVERYAASNILNWPSKTPNSGNGTPYICFFTILKDAKIGWESRFDQGPKKSAEAVPKNGTLRVFDDLQCIGEQGLINLNQGFILAVPI